MIAGASASASHPLRTLGPSASGRCPTRGRTPPARTASLDGVVIPSLLMIERAIQGQPVSARTRSSKPQAAVMKPSA